MSAGNASSPDQSPSSIPSLTRQSALLAAYFGGGGFTRSGLQATALMLKRIICRRVLETQPIASSRGVSSGGMYELRTRHLMVVVIAVATAGLASFGVYRAVTRIPVREVEVAHTLAVVATRSLPPGVRLRRQTRLAAWPYSSLAPGRFLKVDAVVHHALLASVVENEPIAGKTSESRGGRGPAAQPAGMRAMLVKVNDVIGVCGLPRFRDTSRPRRHN